jgi:hypothetical protein
MSSSFKCRFVVILRLIRKEYRREKVGCNVSALSTRMRSTAVLITGHNY